MAKDTSKPRTSRIGKRPVVLPKGVALTIGDAKVQVKGPKGTLSMAVPGEVQVAQEGTEIRVSSTAPGRGGPRLQGMARALIANMVKGVSEGYERRLELHGTGYRAEAKGNVVHLTLGYSHPIDFPLPDGVSCDVPKDTKGTLLVLQSCDKAVLGQVAATIRSFRPPEPYAGKGIRYRGERVREKAGKAGK